MEVAKVIQGCYEHQSASILGASKEAVTEFVADLILRRPAYMLLTPAGLKEITTKVFEQEDVRDFVLALAFLFFARWGGETKDIEELAKNLAMGVSADAGAGFTSAITSNSGDKLAIPEVLVANLPKYQTTVSVIASNKWLMVLLLIQLFVLIDVAEITKRLEKPGTR